MGLSARHVFRTGSLMVELESHGRAHSFKDLDIVRTVGWFTSTFPFVIQIDRPHDPWYEINRISAARREIPGNGIGYGVLRYLSSNVDPEAKLDVTPQISFNYLGNFKSAYEETFFSIDYGFDAKPSLKAFQTNAKDFDVIAVITDGVLQLDICYNSGHFSQETMRRWIVAYQDKLEQLLDYYTGPGARRLDLSSLGYNNISPDAFERINDLFS